MKIKILFLIILRTICKESLSLKYTDSYKILLKFFPEMFCLEKNKLEIEENNSLNDLLITKRFLKLDIKFSDSKKLKKILCSFSLKNKDLRIIQKVLNEKLIFIYRNNEKNFEINFYPFKKKNEEFYFHNNLFLNISENKNKKILDISFKKNQKYYTILKTNNNSENEAFLKRGFNLVEEKNLIIKKYFNNFKENNIKKKEDKKENFFPQKKYLENFIKKTKYPEKIFINEKLNFIFTRNIKNFDYNFKFQKIDIEFKKKINLLLIDIIIFLFFIFYFKSIKNSAKISISIENENLFLRNFNITNLYLNFIQIGFLFFLEFFINFFLNFFLKLFNLETNKYTLLTSCLSIFFIWYFLRFYFFYQAEKNNHIIFFFKNFFIINVFLKSFLFPRFIYFQSGYIILTKSFMIINFFIFL